MKLKELPPLDYLNANLWYDPRTGLLWWKKKGKKRIMNNPAGGWSGRYHSITLSGQRYQSHRVCWALYHQQLPLVDDIVDHINGTEEGNKITNLRITNQSGNILNSKLSSNNTSGHRGICWWGKREKWHARVMVNYKSISLGLFTNLDDAIAARLQAEKDLNIFHREHS